MRITLIYPLLSRRRTRIDENKQFWPPLGLAYIAAVLETGGHDVQIIDRDLILRKNGMGFERADAAMLASIKDFGASLIGLSATTPNMSDVNFVSRYIKENYKDVPIVLGGPHPSGEPALSLEENPAVDIVVKGEGEFALSDITDGLHRLEEIAGITYRTGGRIVSNGPREPTKDIDELPLPARHLLDMKFYTRPSRFTSRNLSLRTTSIFTARGCPYRCNFCAGPLVFSGRVRFHSPGRVIREIDEILSRYSVEALYFAEDMFLSSRERAEELLNLFIDKGINKRLKWFAQAKANIITEELLRLMKDAGCIGIEYGFESGSQRVLDLMNKRLKVEESLRAAELTRRAGMRFQANMIVGYPGEREDDFKKTMEFVRKIRPSMVGFNIFMPLPGTPSYAGLKSDGRKIPRWDDIGDPEAPQVNYADMPSEIFERLYLEARLKVILPGNLRNFIKDNIKNPLRLLKVGLTQFGGVLIKTLSSVFKLASLKRAGDPAKTQVLFLSYNGLLEPILPSQAVPYLKGLAKAGFEFVLLTYEKRQDLRRAGSEKLKKMKEELGSAGIEWRYLVYHKNPAAISTLFDLICGAFYSWFIISSRPIRLVHIRGITPGAIMILLSRLTRAKILFDMRGLLAEEYVGGGLWKENGARFNLVKKAEERLLKKADAVTVLTRKHLELNKTLPYLKERHIPMDVVPCCVDTDRFRPDPDKGESLKRSLGLDGKFILMYPGKIGTFYFMDEMLLFYRKMLELIPETAFVIVTNDDADAVLKKARSMGIREDGLRVVRGVAFEAMPRYITMADAGIFFINPYKKIGSSPIKMGEFLASGVPVVINPGVGDTEELVRENAVGVVVEEFDEETYAEALTKLFEMRKNPEDLRRRCTETADGYLSLEKGVDKYRRIYEALVK